VRVLSADWVIPVEGAPIRNGAVAIADGRITALGSVDELGEGEHHADAVIIPAFVNAHSHLEYAMYAGFGDGLEFGPWITLHVERKRRLEFDDMEAIARFGAFECLRSGIATVGDCSFSGASATACAALGLRAIVHLEVFGRDRGGLETWFEPNRARVADAFSDAVRLGVSPHAPYTCSPDLYRACADLELPIATHLAESPAEAEWLQEGTGPWHEFSALLVEPLGTTGIRALAANGLLSPTLLAAHCVHVDREEIELLALHDVPVAHCPRSNALLGCGMAPVTELREAGVRVCIATDSPASTPSFDMFDELRAAISTARAREKCPWALTAAEALELATLGGARALGIADETGSIVPGKQADLAVVSLADSPFLPWEDPVTATVFGGSPNRIVATLVSGETRYEKGGVWPELTAAAHSARGRLLSPAAPTS
jgi:cytosine/adenosine deaminase-related metal-dependent hydrolase